MTAANPPPGADASSEVSDQVDEAALTQVMRVVPLGARVVAGLAVALLVIGFEYHRLSRVRSLCALAQLLHP
jgi:hypothetical protein